MEMAVANVVVTSNVVKKPRSPLPPSASSPYRFLKKAVPLTALDLVAPNTPIPMILAFPPTMPSNNVMVDNLLKALFHYPHLVGSFGHDGEGDTAHPSILLDNTGVRVIETEIPTTLQNNLPFDPSNKLYFNLTPLLMSGSELLQIQLNRFACGGMILGMTIHHWVSDATSFASFLTSWSRLVRGLELETLPYHDRSRAVTAGPQHIFESDDHEAQRRKKPFSDCSLLKDALPPVTNLSIHYDDDFLGKLKAKVNGENPKANNQYSTFQCLVAHVWKKMAFVRGLDVDGESTTNFQFSMNGRKRVSPPVPTEYFGNYVLGATATMKVRELLEGSYSDVARSVREAIAKADDAYFRSFVEYGAKVRAEELVTGMVGPAHSLGPHIFCTSWMGLGFGGVDFGSGGLCSFLAPGIPVEGFTLFLPSFEEGGGANFLVAVKDKESADLFMKISHALD